ncbi:unnamed protein product [Durusdinium trenchii]
MLRRAADFEKQSVENSLSSRNTRFTQSCQSFRSLGSMASSRLTRAVSLRQQTSRLLATRGRQSPSASHGKYRIGQLSKLGSGIFHLPEIPGTPVEQGKDAKKASKAKARSKTKRSDGPQEVSLEAARAFWDLAAQEDRRAQQARNGRHRSSQDEDRRQPSNSQSNHYPNYVRHSGPGVPELSHRVGLPYQVAKEAAHLFHRFADFPKGGGIFDGKLKVSQLTEVLVALCEVADASELDKGFTDRAFRAADRDSGGFIDIEEFAIWYSSFCFAEEVTVRPQVRQTRELARQMGLEIWAIEKFRVAFDKYDADGSGEIEFDEFSDMVQELLKIPNGHELPHDRLMTMWRTADITQKGYLDFREFCFFYVRMVSMEEGCDPIRDYYRNVRNVPVAPL